MGKLTNSMWRLLGSQSSRNQSKSVALIKDADTHTSWAADLADDEFAAIPGRRRQLHHAAAILRMTRHPCHPHHYKVFSRGQPCRKAFT